MMTPPGNPGNGNDPGASPLDGAFSGDGLPLPVPPFPTLRIVGPGIASVVDRVAQPVRRRPVGVAVEVRADDVPALVRPAGIAGAEDRSEEHPSELHSLMRTSYAVFRLNIQKYIAHLP